MNRDNVRMFDPGRGPGLTHQPTDRTPPLTVGGAQNFDRYIAIEQFFTAGQDRADPAMAKVAQFGKLFQTIESLIGPHRATNLIKGDKFVGGLVDQPILRNRSQIGI